MRLVTPSHRQLYLPVLGQEPKIKTSPYDVAEYLRTPEEMALYLEAALEEAGEDEVFMARAREDIARAQRMLAEKGHGPNTSQ